MDGVTIGAQAIGTFQNRQEAERAAHTHAGDEVLVQTDQGFEVREATFESPEVRQHYLDTGNTASICAVPDGTNVRAFSFETAAASGRRPAQSQDFEVAQVSQQAADLIGRLPSMSAQQGLDAFQAMARQAESDGNISSAESSDLRHVGLHAQQRVLSDMMSGTGDMQAASATLEGLNQVQEDVRTFNNRQTLNGSQVVDGRFADTRALLADISQLDGDADPRAAMNRCGAQFLLTSLIQRGPAAVDQAITWLRGEGQALEGVSAADGLTRQEMNQLADAIYAEGRERVPRQFRNSEGLSHRELVPLAEGMGLGDISEQRVARDAFDLSTMAVGDSLGCNIAPPNNGGAEGHWVAITRTEHGFEIQNPMGETPTQRAEYPDMPQREPALQTFATADEAEAYITAHYPTRGSDGGHISGMLTIPIPAQR